MEDKCEKNYDSLRNWIGTIQRLTKIEGVALECNKRSETNEINISKIKDRTEEIMGQFLNCRETHSILEKQRKANWIMVSQSITILIALTALAIKFIWR